MLLRKVDWGYELYDDSGKIQMGASVGRLPVSFEFTESDLKKLESAGELKVEKRSENIRVLPCKKQEV